MKDGGYESKKVGGRRETRGGGGKKRRRRRGVANRKEVKKIQGMEGEREGEREVQKRV